MDAKIWPTGIRPNGKNIQIRIRGKNPYSETVPGSASNARDLKAAVKYRDELLVRIKLGLPVGQQSSTQQLLFINAAQEYIDTLDVKEGTKTDYKRILNFYWLPRLGSRLALSIERREIKVALSTFKKENGEPITHKTRKNILIPLRGIFDHLEIDPNPAKIKIKKTQSPPVERYSIEERNKLLGYFNGQIKLYFTLIFGLGLRPGGEVLGLRRSDFDGEYIKIVRQITKRRLKNYTKTSKRRVVYVPKWVREVIKETPKRIDSPYIFVNSLGSFHCDTDIFNDQWQQAHESLGIRYRIPYAGRHTRAAELLSSGVEPGKAAKQLGHNTEMFYRTYSEWIDEYDKHKDDSCFEPVEKEA